MHYLITYSIICYPHLVCGCLDHGSALFQIEEVDEVAVVDHDRHRKNKVTLLQIVSEVSLSAHENLLVHQIIEECHEQIEEDENVPKGVTSIDQIIYLCHALVIQLY